MTFVMSCGEMKVMLPAAAVALVWLTGMSQTQIPPATATPTQALDAAIAIVKAQALRRDRVAWLEVEPKVRELANGATQTADVYPAIKFLLSQLQDRHSFGMPPARATVCRKLSDAPRVDNPLAWM